MPPTPNATATDAKLTPAQLSQVGYTYNPAGSLVPTTVKGSALNTTSPVVTPPGNAMAAPMSLNAMVNSFGNAVQTAETGVASAETGYNTATNDLLNLSKQLEGQTADTYQAEQTAGIPQISSDIIELQNQARQKTLEYNMTPYSMAGQGRGVTTGILRGQEAVKQRQLAYDVAVTNSNLQAKQGQLSLAQSTVDRAIQAKYDPIKARIETQKYILDNNKDSLSRADKKLAEARSVQLDLQLKKIETQEKKETESLNIINTAAANGAPNKVIADAQKYKDDPFKVSSMLAGWASDPLDRLYKQKQIQNIDSEIANRGLSSGAGAIDAAGALAYAQQYAATGTIPTGLPKGTFGLVAQVAKELPKPKGTLVDRNTGIKSSSISPTQEDGIIALKDVNTKLAELKTMKTIGGPNTVVAYNSLRSEIIDLLARARTGAAITANEEVMYKNKIPGLTSFVKNAKIEGMEKSIQGKLDTTLSAQGLSIYGYSQVDVGGQNYTVGELVQNESGQTGRINPDGTVTIIQ